MRKHILPVLLVIAVLLVAAISCKNNPSPTPTPTPTRPATLSVYSFKSNYAVGATKADLVGTLIYTDTDGKVTTVALKDDTVEKDFDASKAAEGKVMKISFKGLDTAVSYNVVKMDEVDIYGTYVVGKNTTFTFTSGSRTVTKEVWSNWDQFYNYSGVPTEKTLTYTVTLSGAGRTVIKLDDWTYTPDKEGGLASYPSRDQFEASGSDYAPDYEHFFVSTSPEDNKSITNETARGKYVIMGFNTDGDAYVWFKATVDDLSDLNKGNATYVIPSDKFSFDNAGVYLRNVTVNNTNAKNLTITNKEGYASKERAFSFYSSDDSTTYRGYSYVMKLTNVNHPNIERD